MRVARHRHGIIDLGRSLRHVSWKHAFVSSICGIDKDKNKVQTKFKSEANNLRNQLEKAKN